jgi:FtsZ-binding cell division protein ZapB
MTFFENHDYAYKASSWYRLRNTAMINISLQKLETKINEVIETVELLHLQVDESEQANARLQQANTELKQQQNEWEQTVIGLLSKLEKLQIQQATAKQETAAAY